MVGVAFRFRRGVFLCAEVPACTPGDVGLESQGRQPGTHWIMVFLCAFLQQAQLLEWWDEEEEEHLFRNTWPFPGGASV